MNDRNGVTTEWPTIEAVLLDRFGARPRWRGGRTRSYWIPTPYTYSRKPPGHTDRPGHFTVDVRLNPRWCAIAVDRWHTTDRPAESREWFEEHVWPHVNNALGQRRRGAGFLPIGNPTHAYATPIDRDVLLDVLIAWVRQELIWCYHAEKVPTS